MTEKYNKYILEEIQRISVQYYLIKIHHKYYLIDYSDPKNLSNYFITSFFNIPTEWIIYDVTETKEQYQEKKAFYLLKNIEKIATVIFLGFILNGMLFPTTANISQLTADDRIGKHWLFWLATICVGAILISIFLNILNQPKINVDKTQTYLLKQVNSKKNRGTFVIAIMYYLLAIFFSILLGLSGNNYGSLLIFGYLSTYLIIFGQFLNCSLNKENKKYQILKKEER